LQRALAHINQRDEDAITNERDDGEPFEHGDGRELSIRWNDRE
jgi:hypothetical protein